MTRVIRPCQAKKKKNKKTKKQTKTKTNKQTQYSLLRQKLRPRRPQKLYGQKIPTK